MTKRQARKLLHDEIAQTLRFDIDDSGSWINHAHSGKEAEVLATEAKKMVLKHEAKAKLLENK